MPALMFCLPYILFGLLIYLLIRAKIKYNELKHKTEAHIESIQREATSRVNTIQHSSESDISQLQNKHDSELRIARLVAENQMEAIRARSMEQIEAAQKHASYQVAQAEEKLIAITTDMRHKADSRIRVEKDRINIEKEKLQLLSEKELIIESILAINTYADRINRLENKLSNIIVEFNKSNNRNQNSKKPFNYSGIITEDDFTSIVLSASRKYERIQEIYTEELTIFGEVISIQKSSTWEFEIDFNDGGNLTGNYTLLSQNDTSNIPQRLAEEVRKEIVYRLNA